MKASPATSTPQAPSPSLRHAFSGVWRLTFPGFLSPGRLLLLAGLLAALALLTLATTRHGGTTAFFDWTIKFYLTFLVPVLAFISAGGAIRDDLKPATVDYVFTRPVQRPTFVVCKFLAHLAGAQATGLLALGALAGVGLFRGVPGLWTALPLLLLAQILAVTIFTAFGFLCGTVTTRYLIVGLLYGGVVEIGIGAIPTQLNRLSMLHHVNTLLQPLTITAPAVAPPGLAALPTAALLVLVSAAMIAVAALLFGARELAGSRPKES